MLANLGQRETMTVNFKKWCAVSTRSSGKILLLNAIVLESIPSWRGLGAFEVPPELLDLHLVVSVLDIQNPGSLLLSHTSMNFLIHLSFVSLWLAK
jgi:hypothetical protein